MNERIQLLAEQAESTIGGTFTFNGSDVSIVDLEKFAELIVRECYLWAKENGGLGSEEDFEALKEHFGVEE
jgi:hypothetical protein